MLEQERAGVVNNKDPKDPSQQTHFDVSKTAKSSTSVCVMYLCVDAQETVRSQICLHILSDF